jgi:ribosomal protein L35
MGKGMKTNKSYSKRLKVTKNGKLIGRKPGFNHFNAKQSRNKQLAGKKGVNFVIKNKEKSYLLPFS